MLTTNILNKPFTSILMLDFIWHFSSKICLCCFSSFCSSIHSSCPLYLPLPGSFLSTFTSHVYFCLHSGFHIISYHPSPMISYLVSSPYSLSCPLNHTHQNSKRLRVWERKYNFCPSVPGSSQWSSFCIHPLSFKYSSFIFIYIDILGHWSLFSQSGSGWNCLLIAFGRIELGIPRTVFEMAVLIFFLYQLLWS